MVADGETYLNLAKILLWQEDRPEAKAAAKQALAKGVKKPDDAKKILALPATNQRHGIAATGLEHARRGLVYPWRFPRPHSGRGDRFDGPAAPRRPETLPELRA